MYRVLPLVIVAVLAKLAIHALNWDTVSLNPLHSGLVAGTVFLIGFLLAGTLTDYKESEKLPGEIAGRSEAIADECEILYRESQAPVALQCLQTVGRFAAAVNEWLHGRARVDGALECIDELNRWFREFQPLTQPGYIVRLKQEQNLLRLLVIRIDTIKETSFVGAGYVVAKIVAFLLVIGLLVAESTPLAADCFLIGSITFLLSYMIGLIKDMDNPFEYAGVQHGTVEVSLAALDRLEQRILRERELLLDADVRTAEESTATPEINLTRRV